MKALLALRELRDKAYGDGTANGKYGILPRGFGDSGIGGVRSEYTNTLWTMMALKKMLEVSDRLFLLRRSDAREFYRDLRAGFSASRREELKRHPKGFDYLPMLMKEDSQWQEKDERKQPRAQVAQVFMSQASYPGMLWVRDDGFVTGNIDLMKSVMKEDIPVETGWLTDEGASPYNAAILAQTCLYTLQPDLARKAFIGFLNHASPLYAWREEQSLLDAKVTRVFGDMPHTWASAECIRYLRHMMILEDEFNLRILEGVGLPELNEMQPIALTSSPTRWGRITLSLEPVDKKNWRTKFFREGFDAGTMSKFNYVEMPRKLAGEFYFDKFTGVNAYKNGDRILIPAGEISWECTWRSL